MEGGGGGAGQKKGGKKVQIRDNKDQGKGKDQSSKANKSQVKSDQKKEPKKTKKTNKEDDNKEAEVDVDEKKNEPKEPCDHEYCNPPESNPSYYPKGLPWSTGNLKCLPGYCDDHKKFADEARKNEEANADVQCSTKKQREVCERKRDQEKVDDARDDLLYILKKIQLLTQPGMKEWVNGKLEAMRDENKDHESVSKTESGDSKKSEKQKESVSREKSKESQKTPEEKATSMPPDDQPTSVREPVSQAPPSDEEAPVESEGEEPEISPEDEQGVTSPGQQ